MDPILLTYYKTRNFGYLFVAQNKMKFGRERSCPELIWVTLSQYSIMLVRMRYFIKITFPIKLSLSRRNLEESTAATNTLKAPSGVTNAAGAKAYARRLAASPIPTETILNIYKNTFSFNNNLNENS